MNDRSLLVAKRQAAHALRALPRTALARRWLGVVLAGTLAFSVVADASDIESYAIMQDDGSLRAQGKTIRLFWGLHAADRARLPEQLSPSALRQAVGAGPQD